MRISDHADFNAGFSKWSTQLVADTRNLFLCDSRHGQSPRPTASRSRPPTGPDQVWLSYPIKYALTI